VRPSVEIVMHSGEKHWAAGYASRIAEQVAAARHAGDPLISIERDRIPTGQMMHLDPQQIESIKDDR